MRSPRRVSRSSFSAAPRLNIFPSGGSFMTISFASTIRPLFRDKDVASMKGANLDLSSHADVSKWADAILKRLEKGDMPCDGSWPDDKVQLFRQWIADGKKP
jgi:hypothetical protein